ncbi:hypothetical protein QFZ39_005115 [Paraburkholderia graminis]|nr:hypothetical protein [Paraburkholderia graminis]
MGGDRQGAFEPKLVERHQTRWTGFDDKIISLYARGLSVREIQGHLEEMYGTEAFTSSLTASVTAEISVGETPFTQNSGHPPPQRVDHVSRNEVSMCRFVRVHANGPRTASLRFACRLNVEQA